MIGPVRELGRDLVCAFNVFEEILRRFPKRKVYPDRDVPSYHVYYYSKRARRNRWIDWESKEISEFEYDKFGFPETYSKQIR